MSFYPEDEYARGNYSEKRLVVLSSDVLPRGLAYTTQENNNERASNLMIFKLFLETTLPFAFTEFFFFFFYETIDTLTLPTLKIYFLSWSEFIVSGPFLADKDTIRRNISLTFHTLWSVLFPSGHLRPSGMLDSLCGLQVFAR